MASKVKVNTVETESGSTLTLGKSGDTVTLASGASQSGFGRTGTVDWDTTAKTANFTAVSGDGFFVNTTSGAITVTLPAGSAGSIVSFKDYANTWDTNNLTITPDGTDKINGVNADAVLNTEDQSVTLVYVDDTKGWRVVQDSTSAVDGNAFISATGGTITTCGNCKIHTFTSPGTFCVSAISSTPANNAVGYMVVAGGGSGAGNTGNAAGGGGAGGFREGRTCSVTPYTISPLGATTGLTVTATAFPITVGAGGAAVCFGNPGQAFGNAGSDSIFSTITSAGGGAGGHGGGVGASGGDGGSGGGAGGGARDTAGGSGNTPPVSPPQGNNGGASTPPSNPTDNQGAGGGGATAVGQTASSSNGNGGAGATTCISGSPTAYSGGGGAGTSGPNPTAGSGGTGGGGAGGEPTGNAGTANTGGGGGGGSNAGPGASGAGGSGVVIIRYKFQ
jgi:hypothetical protein